MNSLHTFVVLAYKESPFLEDCIMSVINQSIKTNVIIATSTPCKYIKKIAEKYNLEVVVNKGKKGIGSDFDFAIKIVDTELITIAHQDDIYDYTYVSDIIKTYKNNVNINPIIIFPDYYEIRSGLRVENNRNLRIKRFLLFPLRFKKLCGFRFFKRWSLRFGDAISCPSVTFVRHKIVFPVFDSNLKCNIDWNAWEKLSKKRGAFVYISKPLMGHRVHDASTTSEIIKNNIRTMEDYEIFSRFWIKPVAKIITKIYKKSEKSNEVVE